MQNKYKFLDHPSELKMQIFGSNLSELFTNAALGMMEYLYSKNELHADVFERIEIEAETLEDLLIDWLAEILYLSDSKKHAYVSYHILELSDKKIIAEVGSVRAIAINDIKAVTYSELTIAKKDDSYEAIIVFDI
jgi:SHS2 domain-containing protein